MKAYSTQQEILLVNGTGFPSREFCEPSDGINYWSGILPDMLPEIFEKYPVNKKLKLREMMEGSLFIELKLGEIYLELEKQSSIDPYSFLPMQILS